MTDESDTSDTPNLGHFHEIMDRASVLMNTFAGEILDTLAVKTTPDLLAEATAVFEVLHSFYQFTGAIHDREAEMAELLHGGPHECGRLTIFRTRCAKAPNHGGPCANETHAEAACTANHTDPKWSEAKKRLQ